MGGGKITLRPYQLEAVEALDKYWGKYTTKTPPPCVLQLSTGSGKSIIITEIVKRHNLPTLILQPTKEILEQNYEKLKLTGLPPSQIAVCSASANSWKIGQITLATIGTIWKHSDFCQHFKLVIIDEAHTFNLDNPVSQYFKLFANLPPDVRYVGLTASPFRHVTFTQLYKPPKIYCRPLTRIATRPKFRERLFPEEEKIQKTVAKRFGKFFWKGGIIYKLGIKPLQESGYLSKTQYHEAETDWSFLQYHEGNQDYDTKQMTKWGENSANISTFHQSIDWCIRHKFKTIVFSPNIEISFLFAEEIRKLGGSVQCLDSTHDSKSSRANKMANFKAWTPFSSSPNSFQFLVNVGMVGVGVDVPSIDCVILARPSKSLPLILQFIGRALRPDPSNPAKIAQIVDLSGNIARFGQMEDVELVRVSSPHKNNEVIEIDAIQIRRDGKIRLHDRIT